MADYLHTQRIFSAFDRMIRESEEFITIVSPYIILDGEQSMLLRNAAERGVSITIIYRLDSTETAKRLKVLSDLPGIKILGCPDLHAKIYATEDVAILTSKNLTTRKSDCCSIEIGILVERDDDFYEDLINSANEFEQISKKNVLVDNSATLEQIINPKGYCIRCGTQIRLNADYPLCTKCYSDKNSADCNSTEKYCHFCGKEAAEITLRYPVEGKCYSSYLSVHQKSINLRRR